MASGYRPDCRRRGAVGRIRGLHRFVPRHRTRLRDLEIADGGKTIYIVTDSAGGVLNATGEGVGELENPGAILVYTAK